MNCYNHPLRQGVNTCSKCGHWLCDECSVEIDGRIYCRSCLGKHSDERREKRYPNILLLMMFSGLPGANYMYMGLIKRGLFVLTAFFLSIYLTAEFFGYAAFVIVGIVITSFFDGLRIRRKFIAGEPVSDDVNDIKAFFSANKLPIIGVTAIIVIMEVIQNAARWVSYGVAYGHGGFRPSGVVAIAAVALGIYFLSKLRKEKPEHKDDDLQ